MTAHFKVLPSVMDDAIKGKLALPLDRKKRVKIDKIVVDPRRGVELWANGRQLFLMDVRLEPTDILVLDGMDLRVRLEAAPI